MTTGAAEPVRRHAPERIGRYQIIERIGRGAMGVVYRARDEAMGRDVALKVLTADFEDDPDIKTRFHREAEAAARLQHPNIINILDVGEDGHRFFIVMELLRGLPLKEFLKQPDVTLERKLDLMTQLCAGVGAAHKSEIFHRDIKPGNLFVRTDGILKILDFGVARLASSSMTASGFIVGTPDYMSPEQACGTEIDGRSDIFSIGGVFYYMVAGRKPFPATHLPTLFQQIQSEAPQPVPDAPPALMAVIRRALAKQPAQRYQTCAEIVADLEALERPGALDVRPASESGRPAPPAVTQVARASGTPAAPSTDDTVNLSPAAFVSTDDTVRLGPQPSWWQDAAGRVADAASMALARLKRAGTPVANTGDPDIRKRSM